MNLKMGVPQGGVLSPVLFLLYINDLPSKLNHSSVMYADDISLIVTRKKNEASQDSMVAEVDRLLRWFSCNKLYLNLDKTKLLQFHTSQNHSVRPVNVNIGGSSLIDCETARFLGITLDSKLNFQSYVDGLVAVLNSKCYQVRVLRDILDMSQLRTYYFAQVHCRLAYGVTIWGHTAAMHIAFRAQKRLIRAAFRVARTYSCRDLFRQLGVLPLPSLYILETLAHVFKNYSKFTVVSNVHSHFTRGCTGLYVPYKRINLSMRAPDTVGLRLYNRLPEGLKGCATLHRFKGAVKAYLLHHCCYSVDEYLSLN